MAEYINREVVLSKCDDIWNNADETTQTGVDSINTIDKITDFIESLPAADVQEKKYCKMIPLELDSRGCTNVFICTNCHQYIYLGFIQKEYSGSYCSECGAEVKDGDTNG